MKVTEMTQMGLSNTGTEIIRVDSEIIPTLSPTVLDGDKNFIGYSYTDTTTDLRYMNYNTRTSKLWNAFGIEFKEEIKKLSDRERLILSLRYMKGKTQMEVSSQIGISQAQVSRLEKGAICKIKGYS